ncbi:MAG: hypothetical protein ACYDHG_04075 [Desulfomonilaceae bacterium]
MNKNKKEIDQNPKANSLTDQILALANSERGKGNVTASMESSRESLERLRKARRRGSDLVQRPFPKLK